ncbi:hypothetical protein EML15_08095 [Corynebacterium sp. sy017]|uniref:hypothetical protein n=1 Tax=unclassified Corynebacterium TaxID=2624378 RepID=UPI0011872C20|nr:hypothetical protein [Corynebacterium sp. sy017]MBP3089104.1 hypothetical protein [Corynebacterium sp. sy017]TSD91418.1 hypothetical protein ELY17_08105 [Corynebacterium sp. SY003]
MQRITDDNWEYIERQRRIDEVEHRISTIDDAVVIIGHSRGAESIIIPDAGHIATDDGYGSWSKIIRYIEAFAQVTLHKKTKINLRRAWVAISVETISDLRFLFFSGIIGRKAESKEEDMRSEIFFTSLFLFAVGLLFIGKSEGSSSWYAVLGFIFLVLGLVGIICGFVAGKNKESSKSKPTIISLDENEKESLKDILNSQGSTRAARKLRENHPNTTLVQAKHTIDALR